MIPDLGNAKRKTKSGRTIVDLSNTKHALLRLLHHLKLNILRAAIQRLQYLRTSALVINAGCKPVRVIQIGQSPISK